DYTEEVHATVIHESGLLLALQDQRPAKQPIHSNFVGTTWQAPVAGSSPDPANQIASWLTRNVLFFDRKDDYIDLVPLEVNWSKGLTIEAWVKFSEKRPWSRILELSNGPQNGNVTLTLSSPDAKLYFEIYPDDDPTNARHMDVDFSAIK